MNNPVEQKNSHSAKISDESADLKRENQLLLEQVAIVQEELERVHSLFPKMTAAGELIDNEYVQVCADGLRNNVFIAAFKKAAALERTSELKIKSASVFAQGISALQSRFLGLKAVRANNFGKITAAYSASGIDAVEAIFKKVAASPAIKAAALTVIARALQKEDVVATAELAYKAYELEPKPFRLKWLAFRQHEAGNLEQARANLDCLPPETTFSESESRQADQLREQSNEYWLDKARVLLGLPTSQATTAPSGVDMYEVNATEPEVEALTPIASIDSDVNGDDVSKASDDQGVRSLARRAERAFLKGDILSASAYYRRLSDELGPKFFNANIEMCNNRIATSMQWKDLSGIPLKQLRIAAVMDEFTFHSYDPECNLLPLDPDRAIEQLQQFQPHLLFIESAWQGFEQKWRLKVSTNGPEINACIDWCRERGIPSLLWNKEDPVHFGTFLPLAKRVDYVFTTDVDCIPKYKSHVGHDQVFLLGFAAQPKVHNPIEIFERKDAFNFAGSYYVRYPERQRDFSSLVDTISEFRPVEIYDRNADNSHPHYTFPERYRPLILGRLPFSDIDRAYKGYRYGINMNTIKQSQSMFARRVFELLASNTVVVSNFSRGMRLLFGDLVVCSDSSTQLAGRLKKIVSSDIAYRKFRLLGLRKVMAEHTYRHRLSYICSKISRTGTVSVLPSVFIIAKVGSKEQADRVVAAFDRQRYARKNLLLIGATSYVDVVRSEITVLSEHDAVQKLCKLHSDTLVGAFEADDYYGENYLTDLALASIYSQGNAWVKSVRYKAVGTQLLQGAEERTYVYVKQGVLRSALVRRLAVNETWLTDCVADPSTALLTLSDMLAIDEFNYIENGAMVPGDVHLLVDDLVLLDQGIGCNESLADVSSQVPITAYRANEDSEGLPSLDSKRLAQLITPKKDVAVSLVAGKLRIQAQLGVGRHEYLYAKQALPREQLNLVLNSQFRLICEGTLDVRTIFEFQDKDGTKISHQINKAGDKHSLAIPAECELIRIGLRVEGSGRLLIEKLVLGSHIERPATVICRAPVLVLTKQYPAYDDLYRYGFLHSRIRGYKENGTLVSVFRISNDVPGYREFEGIDVVTGDADLLDATLASGQVKHVLVHMMDVHMWKVLEKHIHNIKVTVWAHGAEIQSWNRRQFEFVLLDEEEIEHKKKLGINRMKFWQGIFKNIPENLHMVFVSRSLAEEAFEDVGIRLPDHKYSIINNPIDTQLFSYQPKSVKQRKKILSVRSFATRMYANDVTVKVIEVLSNRPEFADLEFKLVGDGELFDSTVEPVRKFNNVSVEKRFLTHEQIAALHKEYGVFLVPTRWDSQGVSRDEAMSSGLVPVTNDVAAVSEFVSKENGILCASEDAVGMAEAILALYHDEALFLKLSAEAAHSVNSSRNAATICRNELALLSLDLIS